MTYVPLKMVETHSRPRPVVHQSSSVAEHEMRLWSFARFPKENPKILLLEPFYPAEAAWGSAKVEQGFLPPLGTISIYRWLREKGYEVDFIDTQFGDYTEASLRELLREGKYHLVGIPVFTPTAGHSFNTVRMVRQALPDAVIVLGGVHVTSLSVESLEECPEADFVIRREGEITLTELIETLSRGETDFSRIEGLTWWRDSESIVMNPDRALLPELDELPFGMFGDLDLARYVPHPTQYVRLPNYPFVTQRGCPYPCTYCEAHVTLGKKLRLFSPQRVIEELKFLKYEKGARGIYFQDSTFTMNRKYIVELFELMIGEGLNDMYWSCNTRTDRVDPDLLALMYESGCRMILYGIESANLESLKIIKKNITPEAQEQAGKWT
ncbi:MAG: radical SAM protein, partial [bacterium]|nr:radical SAM protein [bacterium]